MAQVKEPLSFFGSCFISRAAKTENPVPRSFFAPKPNGNACYAGYMLCTLVQCCALNLQECVIMLNVESLSWIINFECWNAKLKVGCYNLMLAAQVECWVLRGAVVIPFGHSLYLQHFTYTFISYTHIIHAIAYFLHFVATEDSPKARSSLRMESMTDDHEGTFVVRGGGLRIWKGWAYSS